MGPRERKLIIYIRKRMEAIWGYVLDYYFVCGLFRLLAFFSYLVEIVVLFTTRVFLIGNPYLIVKEGEVLWDDFPHFNILA